MTEPSEEIIFLNTSSYAPWAANTPHRKITLVVEAITDMVPGAFHQPIDLIKWINQNPYVRAVRFTPDPVRDAEWAIPNNLDEGLAA